MALSTTQYQNELQAQRYANAMYDVQVGSDTMGQVLSDFNSLGTDVALNTYYNISHGGMSTGAVIDMMLGNIGVVLGENGLTADDVTAVRDAAIDYLNAAAPGARGAAIADMLDIYADLAGGATVYAAAAADWNAEVATALDYDGSADVLVGTIDSIDAFLTVGPDNFRGSDADDTFTADVMQNSQGYQVNSLATGDRLDGRGGNHDTLEAQVTEGAFLGGGNMPIQPRTTDIEVVKLEALNSSMDMGLLELNLNNISFQRDLDLSDLLIPNTDVFVNADHMTGLDMISSWGSEADLTIRNLTTTDSDGSYRDTNAITIGMGYTGNTDSHWDESDFHVYFNQNFLSAGEALSTSSKAYYYLLDQDAVDDGQPELNKIDRDGIRFSLDGVPYEIIPGTFAPGEDAIALGQTWEGYRDALQAELDAMLASGEFDRLSTLVLSVDPTDFPLSDIDETFDDSGVLRDVDAIVVTDTAGGSFTDLGYHIPDDNSGEFNVYGRFSTQPALPIEQLIAVNVVLEKVGTGGDGGELVIGGMYKGGDNEWGDGSATTPAGVEQFNVVVNGPSHLPNSLSSLRSTNNALQVVNVTSEAGVTADNAASLQIGNNNTDLDDYSNALKDVQTFNASAFLGDLTLFAGITDEAIAKYLDLQDIQTTPSDDNVLFSYAGGVGDDAINLEVAVDTVEHEDFDLEIFGNDGDDSITLTLVDNDADMAGDVYHHSFYGYPVFENWYDNNVLNDNLFIDAGAGDDIVMTPGSGNVNIELGTGDDAAYLDNTGDKAIFVFNTLRATSIQTDINDLQSDANDTYQLFNTTLTVDFMGFEVEVAVPNTLGEATDLQINQAIKDAINNDDVLGKLLNAYDGNGNSLVVESKIDGLMDLTDLTISLEGPSTLTLSDAGTLNAYYGTTLTQAQLVTLIGNEVTAFNTKADYDTRFADTSWGSDIDGDISDHTSDNTVEGEFGNDVFVLGTGDFSNDTVVYKGLGNGNDTVVNFDTTWVPEYDDITESVATAETFSMSFSDFTAASDSITIGDLVVDLNGLENDQGVIPAQDVAFAVATTAGNPTGYTMDAYVAGDTTISWTSTTTGDVVDVTAAALNAADDANYTLTIVDGDDTFAAASAESFDVSFVGPLATPGDDLIAAVDGDFVFDGNTMAYTAGDGPLTLAANLAAGTFDNYTAVNNGDGTVTFTANVTGPVTPGDPTALLLATATANPDLDTDFGDVSQGTDAATAGWLDLYFGVQASWVDGTDQVGFETVVTVPAAPGTGLDYLDFIDYDAGRVTVNNNGGVVDSTFIFDAGNAVSVNLVESTTNDGEYTITVSDQVGIIGVLDFGAEQAFVADNFILA